MIDEELADLRGQEIILDKIGNIRRALRDLTGDLALLERASIAMERANDLGAIEVRERLAEILTLVVGDEKM